jgi:hypothetical protein
MNRQFAGMSPFLIWRLASLPAVPCKFKWLVNSFGVLDDHRKPDSSTSTAAAEYDCFCEGKMPNGWCDPVFPPGVPVVGELFAISSIRGDCNVGRMLNELRFVIRFGYSVRWSKTC